MREPVGECHPLAVSACSGEQAKVAHYAKVTGGCDSKTSSLAADHDVGTHALHCGDEGFT